MDTKSPADSPDDRQDLRKAAGTGRDREMGEALRSVYDQTVRESVPDEMLDLLSKLD